MPKKQLLRSQFILTKAMCKKIFLNARTHRNKIVILLLWKTGIRSDECAGLRVSDIDFENKRLRVIGKGDKERFIPLSIETLHHLEIYIKNELHKKDVWLFPSNRYNNKHITRNQINSICKLAGMYAKVKNPNPNLRHINPHIFRHTFAEYIRSNKFNERELADLMGHENIYTTLQVYGRSPFEKIQRKIERLADLEA